MNRRLFLYTFCVSFLLLLNSIVAVGSGLADQLKKLPGVVGVETLETGAHFSEKYLITFKQLLDRNDPKAGTFNQRVFLSHCDVAKPMVVVTEGYMADYAKPKNYIEELAHIFKTNQVCIEHRYFAKSMPAEPVNYDYLTVENAAADHHAIIQSLRSIYQKKWISTGISKGGQTVIFHRTLYPKDVDISVPYVAPFNYGVEDGRHEPFLEQVGTADERKLIRDFQLEILKRRKTMIPLLKEYVEKRNYTFRIPIDEVLDYSVLEYSFALWQWGTSTEHIPNYLSSDAKLFSHLVRISDPSYFSIEGSKTTLSFFIQAAKEIGYYGYDTKPFEPYLKIKSAKGYLNQIFIPENLKLSFDKGITDNVKAFLRNSDEKMLFVYGEVDPWSAPAVTFKRKKNMIMAVKKRGSHRTRILNMPAAQAKEVVEQLRKWLNE